MLRTRKAATATPDPIASADAMLGVQVCKSLDLRLKGTEEAKTITVGS